MADVQPNLAGRFPAEALPAEPVDLSGRVILQVVPTLDNGGAETTTCEVAAAIIAAGGTALVASEGGVLVETLEQMGAEVIILPVASKNPLTMWRNRRRLAQVIRSYGVDVIHARSRAPAWSSFWAARRARIAYMATYHGLVHAAPRLKVLYNSVLTRGAAVIANSSYTAGLISDVHRTPSHRIRVVPRGCDVAALAAAAPARASRSDAVLAKRAAWGFGADDFVLMCPARITELKGQDVLIKAFAAMQAKAAGRNVKLVFVGGAQGKEAYLDSLQALATAQGVSADVCFAGLEQDMITAYAASDAAIVPSTRAEPFGRTVIEAQAASLPVIASDAGGFRETVMTGDAQHASGWLVAPGDVADLAQVLLALLALPDTTRAQLGENGRQNVSRYFTEAALCARTLGVYQDVITPR